MNNYEVAEIVVVGRAQDVVLGGKVYYYFLDSLTLELGTEWIPSQNDD